MNAKKLTKLVETIVILKPKLKCPICLDVMQDVVELDCGHKYCKECYLKHKSTQKQPSCPLCKRVFKRRSAIYTDNYASTLGKFVYNCCKNIKGIYKCEVEQLQKQLREETELSLNKDNILQQNVNKNNSLAVPSTSKETSQKKKQIGPSKEKYDAKKVNKKRIGDVSLKENCEIAFDKLMVNQPHTTFNRKGTKRVYINKKKKPKVEYNILEFDNHENKTAVLQWLNDTRNKFDRLSQTQNVTTEDTCEIPVIDLASISQVKGTEDKSKPMVTKVRRGRAKSLNIEVKKVVPTQKKQHLEATSVSLENYDIDDNTEEEEVVKKAEEKVIFDLIEDEFLDTLDDELQCAKDEFEVKSKRYMRSKKDKPLSPTSTTGWERLTKIKKTIKKNEKVPKQLNITLQSVDEPKNDKPSRCKKKTNTVKTTDADKQDDDLKEETVTRNEAMDFEKSNSLENQVCKSRIILNRSESSASDKKVDTIKTIGIDKQNGDSKQSIIREEKVDVQNESRPPEDEIRTKSGPNEEIFEAVEAQKLTYDLEILEDYIMKNIEIINKNTFGDGSPSSSNSQQKKEDIEVQNCELEDQPPSSKIHLEKDISTSRDSTCILLDMFSMPTQKISHGDSSESKQENEVITIEDDVTQIESKKPNLQDGSAIHSGTGDSKCEQDTSLDEIEKLYTCPTQKINHICEDVGAMDILVEKYSSKEGLLYLFEECLEECIKNVKSADTTIENHLRTLQFYLSKLKSLHKNDNKLMEEKSSDKELCDAEAQVTVDITDETVQTEYNGTDIGIQTEDLHCIKCNIDLNRNRVVGAATLISQDKKNPAECEKKLSSHDTGLNKTNTPLLNQHMQCDEFTCTLDNLNFETQDLTTNQGIITKIFSKSRSQKSKTSQNEAHTSVTKAKENIVGDILMCSVDSNKSVGSNRINQKSTCDADKSIRFKRIKPPTSDSDSEDDVPAKRKCNRFLRDDLTIEFLNNPEGTDFKNKTSLVESQNSEGINYDEYLAEVMKKYEDNNFSANSSPSFKKPKVLMLKQELMRKCGEMATNVNKNTNSAKAVTEMSVASSKDSFRTAFEDNFAEALMEDDVFMNEENLLKLENEIRKYESSVKVQNSEISDIIGETEEIEPAPKKVKRTTTLKVNDLMHQDQSEDNLLYKKSDLNVSNKLSDALKGTEIENLSELSEREINLHEEKKINILSNVKIKSQDRKEDEDVEEEDLFSDEDIVETTPQKKVDSFAERSACSQIMDSINLINNALLVTPTEADNFDYDIVPLPPPPDFQDDVTDNPPTPDYIDNDNQDNMSVINLNKSSLTPDNLSQFIFRNTKSSKILSPCIQEFSKENKNEKSTLTKNKEELNRKPLDENDLSLMSDKQDVRPMQEAMIHSTPIVEAELTRETLGFSPITAKKSQKMGMIETAETAKYTPLSILTTQTPQKQNLFTSTPRQKSIWNYVKPSRSNEETAPSIAKTKPCIACTRLTKEKTKLVSNLTNKKLATYNPQFNETVTHMIVMANKENCVKDYTIKFVSAVAAGIWVLRFEWIEECLSKNCIVPEEPFEVLDISGLPGPRTSRLMRKQNPLFRGYKFFCAEPFISTTRKEIENIIKMLEGRVLDSLKDLLENDGNIGIIIGEGHGTQDFEQYERWVEKYKTVTVDIEWLSKCVGQYKILSIRPYVWCSEDNLGDLEYPSILTETVPLSFTETY